MKKFLSILSFLALTSCMAPSYASSSCIAYKDVAEEFMIVRQTDVPLNVLVTEIFERSDKLDKDVLKSLVMLAVKAYEIPVEDDPKHAAERVMNFSQQVYRVCVGYTK